MSHAQERSEKNCLNCGTTVLGRYCHKCGQENIVPHETFGHMVKHFFYDITHFDSQFFDSVKYLVTRPGFLSKQYMLGKRASYLNPIKMYVFTSAVFFLIFFSLYSVNPNISEAIILSENEFKKAEIAAYEKSKNKKDSLAIGQVFDLMRSGSDTTSEKKVDSAFKKKIKRDNNRGINFSYENVEYKSLSEYDSIQKTLGAAERDNWFKKAITRKNLQLKDKYTGDNNKLLKDIGNKFIHSFPYMLFVSLPLYALFLKLLYIRNKKFYFADHGIFLVHLYIFTFILLLFFFGLEQLDEETGWGWLGFIQAALIFYGIWYAYRSMRNFYEQGFGKTLLKFILLNFLCFISLIFLFTLFLLISVMQV